MHLWLQFPNEDLQPVVSAQGNLCSSLGARYALLSRPRGQDHAEVPAGLSKGGEEGDCLGRDTGSCFCLFQICRCHQPSALSATISQLAKARGGRPGCPLNLPAGSGLRHGRSCLLPSLQPSGLPRRRLTVPSSAQCAGIQSRGYEHFGVFCIPRGQQIFFKRLLKCPAT